MNVRSAPIGVFDSGVGGLSVLREVRALLPREALLYYADSAYCPYGDKAPAAIVDRTVAVAEVLLARGAKLLVVACNTATSVALPTLRARFPAVPVVGMVPAVKPAAAATRTGKIGVLATSQTVSGAVLAGLIREHAPTVEVILVPAPGLVAVVEAGDLAGPRVEAALCPLLAPLVAGGVDTLVLGCTHFPFLGEAIRRVTGPDLALVDAGEAVARRIRDVLDARALCAPGPRDGAVTLLTSGDEAAVRALATRLMAVPRAGRCAAPPSLAAAG